MRRIAKDSRHHNIVVLQRLFVAQRSFQDWAMGLCDLTPEVDVDGLDGFLNLSLHDAWGPEVAPHARILLENFIRRHC